MKKQLLIAVSVLLVGYNLFAMKARDKIEKMKQVSSLIKQIETAPDMATVEKLEEQADLLIKQLNLTNVRTELVNNVVTRGLQLGAQALADATRTLNTEFAQPQFAVSGTPDTFARLLASPSELTNAANQARLIQLGDTIKNIILDTADVLDLIDLGVVTELKTAISKISRLESSKSAAANQRQKDSIERELAVLKGKTKKRAEIVAALALFDGEINSFINAVTQFSLPTRKPTDGTPTTPVNTNDDANNFAFKINTVFYDIISKKIAPLSQIHQLP